MIVFQCRAATAHRSVPGPHICPLDLFSLTCSVWWRLAICWRSQPTLQLSENGTRLEATEWDRRDQLSSQRNCVIGWAAGFGTHGMTRS